MSTITSLRRLSASATGLKMKFCLFWGIPCKIPISTANDDFVFLRACARAKRKAWFHQKLPIWVMMTPIMLIFLFHPNTKLIVVLIYLFPYCLAHLIVIVAGTWSATRGSFDIHTRNEYLRLLRAAEADQQEHITSSDTAQNLAEAASPRSVRS